MKVVFDCFGTFRIFSANLCGPLCLCGESCREIIYHRDTEAAQRDTEFISAQQRLYILSRSSQSRAIAALDDWPLDQIRMFDHQRNDLVVTEIFLAQTKLAID